MSYMDWYSVEEIYAGTTLRDKDYKEENNLALHTCQDEKAVIENRKLLMKELNHNLDLCVFADQTHSCNIHKVIKEDIGAGAYSVKDAIADCDALYTKEKNVLLGVFTADCVPILIYDKGQGIIAAIHAGWKGTVQEITKKMLDILIYEEDCDPNELYAYIGPAIDFFSFEVGEDVIKQVKAMSFDTTPFIIPKENGKYLLDNKRLNMQMLLDAKIPDTHIFMHNADTYEEEENFFSYRKNKDSGRNLTFILRK